MANVAEILASPPPAVVLNRLTITPANPHVSPVSNRRILATTSERGTSLNSLATPFVAQTNDDKAERGERRKSRVLELQRNNLASPASPAEKRQTAPLAGFTNDQLAEHYANCIKLSAENKINAKNAFGLHLIDYMSELMKKKEINNFQMASSSLDASAKIYAGRVDAIHNETFKVLMGLGRGNEKRRSVSDEGESQDGGGTAEEIEEQPNAKRQPKKKKRGGKKSATVTTNLKTINLNKLDLEYEVEPLFGHISQGFEDQTSGGLLLTNLRCLDESSQLILDSKTKPPSEKDVAAWKASRKHCHTVRLTPFHAILGKDFKQLHVCEALRNFEFGKSNASALASLNETIEKGRNTRHAFDLEAAVDLPSIAHDETQHQGVTGLDGMCDDFADVDDDDLQDNYDSKNMLSMTQVKADGEEEMKKGLVESTMQDIKFGTVGNLMQVLADQPSDYSYFSSKALQMWAGPSHWKLRTNPKVAYAEQMNKGKDTTRSRAAAKAEKRSLTFLYEKNLDDHFKEKRAATTFTKARLDQYSQTDKTFPPDLHYDAEDIFKLYEKPDAMVKAQNSGNDEGEDKTLETYNYDNVNDKDNFCPINQGADDDDYNDAEPLSNFTPDDGFSQESVDDTSLKAGYGLSDLVAAPRKVAKIDIAYARTAKRMDLRRLKHEMWNILDSGLKTIEDTNNETEDLEAAPEKRRKLGQTMPQFSQLLNELPPKLPKHMAENLSTPIAFVALLHLANEKVLKLEDFEDLGELKIYKG